jgi:hypothetical protein
LSQGSAAWRRTVNPPPYTGVARSLSITLQDKDDYKNMASFDSTRKLYTHCSGNS